jgi:hypothetical protein
MHLVHEKGVAYTSFMAIMWPLSLFPPLVQSLRGGNQTLSRITASMPKRP